MKKIAGLLALSLVLASVPFSASAAVENPVSAKVIFGQTDLKSKVDTQRLAAIEGRAKAAIQEEKQKQKSAFASESQVFNFMTADEDYSYLYESYSDDKQPVLVVSENSLPQEQESSLNAQSISTMAAVDIPGGYGGRQKISSSGNTLTTTVTLPSTLTVSGTTATPYIYTGFTGSKEADIGLQYNTNRGPNQDQVAWAPYLALSGGLKGTFVGTNDEVQYKNGFRPGEDIGFQVYKNYNNTGKVRFTAFGYALCDTMGCTNTGRYYLTSILEITQSITSVSSWKLLATVAQDAGTTLGKANFTTKFSNVVIDFTAVPSGSFLTPEEDYATVTRSSNNVTMKVTKT